MFMSRSFNRNLVVAAAAVAAMGLSACQSQDGAETGSSPSAAVSSPAATQDLTQLVSNRTFTGQVDGADYSEYYAEDGTLAGVQAGEKYTGTWEVKGDEICLTYDTEQTEEESGCYTISVDGATVTWTREGLEPSTSTFVEGNPQNL